MSVPKKFVVFGYQVYDMRKTLLKAQEIDVACEHTKTIVSEHLWQGVAVIGLEDKEDRSVWCPAVIQILSPTSVTLVLFLFSHFFKEIFFDFLINFLISDKH